jgi:hypothetical protein
VQSKALQQNPVEHIDAWQAVVTADMSLGEWVTRVQAAVKALEGGEDPLPPEPRRTTGIAAFAHTESKNPSDQAV